MNLANGKREPRAPRGSACDTLRFFDRCVLDHGRGLCLGTLGIDVLRVGVNVLRALADVRDGLHDAILRADRGGGGVGVDLLRVLAAKELQTGSAEQDAGGKQTNMFHSNTSMSSEFAG